jgi:hypothetical protein
MRPQSVIDRSVPSLIPHFRLFLSEYRAVSSPDLPHLYISLFVVSCCRFDSPLFPSQQPFPLCPFNPLHSSYLLFLPSLSHSLQPTLYSFPRVPFPSRPPHIIYNISNTYMIPVPIPFTPFHSSLSDSSPSAPPSILSHSLASVTAFQSSGEGGGYDPAIFVY